MAVSQNGYTVIHSDRVKTYKIPGTTRTFDLRADACGYVLADFARRFNQEVEELVPSFDDWGYSLRKIVGSAKYSNHASGTALDLNSITHAYGEEGTFSQTELTVLRRLLNYYDGVIRWGGDYTYTKDEMHFEIDAEYRKVKRVARKVRRRNAISWIKRKGVFMGAYSRVYWNGKLFNKRTVAMLKEVERRLGYGLTYYQGSYNSSVGASAGTHDGGGAVDLWGKDPEEIIKVMRRVGFAAWVRSPSQGNWPYHIHAIAIGDKELSSGARSQVSAYYNGRDGLASNSADYHPRPSPIPVWKGKRRRPKPVKWSVIKRQFKIKNPVSRWAVKKLQRALNDVGYNLVVDGIAGPKTRAVFRGYRRRHKLGPYVAARKLLLPRFRLKR